MMLHDCGTLSNWFSGRLLDVLVPPSQSGRLLLGRLYLQKLPKDHNVPSALVFGTAKAASGCL